MNVKKVQFKKLIFYNDGGKYLLYTKNELKNIGGFSYEKY